MEEEKEIQGLHIHFSGEIDELIRIKNIFTHEYRLQQMDKTIYMNSESKDDPTREELLWSGNLDTLMNEFMNTSSELSNLHAVKAKKMKKCHIVFALPTILIPVIVTGLSNYIDNYRIVSSVAMIAVGVFSGIGAFFDFSKKHQQHSHYEALYSELYSEIHSEITKPKKNRIAADVFTEKVKNRINFLKQSAPDV